MDSILPDDPQWYKDAIIYELHVRAFYDSDGDGIGDFQGLCKKLDYLQDLGITALWLLPFYPSPLRDDGYDIADYLSINSDYGTLHDFRIFLKEAHRRGIRVITELVINHTSTDHPWFQKARFARKRSNARDFYVWSDNQDRYQEARIIFQDFENSNWAWDPIAKSYYWHRFYSHQPDLNYDNPKVHQAVLKVLDFWLGLGVDGLRLDAVPYLYQRDGTNCENLKETHAFLKKLRKHVDDKYKNRMLLAEANQWPEDAVAYFGNGDECHMAFHFPLMPRMFMALQQEDRFPIIDILEQTPKVAEVNQWALFLRNHDELTLEMVTDEDRDYMYSVYAHDPRARINLGIRRRLAPLLENRRKIELMNALLMSMPGTPVIYYADEIGMGDNIYLGDRNGVRTPMQWSGDRNAGFSKANPQQLYLPIIVDPEYHYEAVNVETQQRNPHSLLWWMKRLIALRRQYPAFSRGKLEFLHPENIKILAFIRKYNKQNILVVANLSRFVQFVELDLSDYINMCPVELFGSTSFPHITNEPYGLSLGPHNFYWFVLESDVTGTFDMEAIRQDIPQIVLRNQLEDIFIAKRISALEGVLPPYLKKRRWFANKTQKIKGVRIKDVIPITYNAKHGYVVLAEVQFQEEKPEIYLLTLAISRGDDAQNIEATMPNSVIARIVVNEERGKERTEPSVKMDRGILHEALVDANFCSGLMNAIARRRKFSGKFGTLETTTFKAFRKLIGKDSTELVPKLSRAEQSNTSVIYGDKAMLKVIRRSLPGKSPELEIGSYLSERHRFKNTPTLAGSISYCQGKKEPVTVALVHEFISNQGDAWVYTVDTLSRFFEIALAQENHSKSLPFPSEHFQGHEPEEILPEIVVESIGTYLHSADLIGQRTAEMHNALAAETQLDAFRPEPFTSLYQRSLYQSIRAQGSRSFRLLEKKLREVPSESRDKAKLVLDAEPEFYKRLSKLTKRKVEAMRIRCHGDYHLGQLLFTGNDFIIVDFEGEPIRSLGERRLKRSALRDVAGMLRSFHYAAMSGVRKASFHRETIKTLEKWSIFWNAWVSARFVAAYLAVAASGGYLPPDPKDSTFLLDLFLIEKAVYELQYELNNRPDWIWIPLQGLEDLLISRSVRGEES